MRNGSMLGTGALALAAVLACPAATLGAPDLPEVTDAVQGRS
jgi:hypothetical protein